MRDPDTAGDGYDAPRAAPERRAGRRWSRRQALAALASVGTVGIAGCSRQSVMSGVAPLWEREFPDAAAAGPPAATDEYVVVGGQDKRLHGFTADGERTLTVETGGPIETRPAVPASGGPVHVHSTDGDHYTVGLSGEQLWHVEGQARDGWLGRRCSLLVRIDPIAETVTGYDAHDGTRRFGWPSRTSPVPTLSDAVCIFVATPSNGRTTLVALAPETGAVRWTMAAPDGVPHVVAAGDRVVTARKGTVRFRRAGDGQVRWETEFAGEVESHFGPPIWLGDQIYVRVRRADGADELVALARTDGRNQWRRRVGYELETVTPTSDGVFVASSVDDPDGGVVIRLDAFDLDGTRRWETTTDLAIGGTVAALVRVGEILVAASDTALAAYDPATGSHRWSYDPESYRIGVTAAADALYVSHRDSGGAVRLPTD